MFCVNTSSPVSSGSNPRTESVGPMSPKQAKDKLQAVLASDQDPAKSGLFDQVSFLLLSAVHASLVSSESASHGTGERLPAGSNTGIQMQVKPVASSGRGEVELTITSTNPSNPSMNETITFHPQQVKDLYQAAAVRYGIAQSNNSGLTTRQKVAAEAVCGFSSFVSATVMAFQSNIMGWFFPHSHGGSNFTTIPYHPTTATSAPHYSNFTNYTTTSGTPWANHTTPYPAGGVNNNLPETIAAVGVATVVGYAAGLGLRAMVKGGSAFYKGGSALYTDLHSRWQGSRTRASGGATGYQSLTNDNV